MSERFAVDTNVLVYSVDSAAGAKNERAMEVLTLARRRDCVLLVQALTEFYHVTTRKGMVRPREALELLEDWMTVFPVWAASAAVAAPALRRAASGRHSIWDAMLLETAAEAGCMWLLSEDLQDGSSHAGVKVCNPFAGREIPLAARRLLGLT